MKYEAPYGAPGSNDPYINGNPATGTMGSIPPAASIENPQREIVNLITDAGIVPTDADLQQLARGVQGGRLNYAIDSGTANALAINVNPPLLAYAAGQRWTVKVFATNTGPSVININGLGARHIVYPQGGELVGGELAAGGLASLLDDGVHLQLANVATATVTGTILTAPKTYYVNSTTGSDTAYDGTAATVSGTHGPFATHNRALTAAWGWNQNGYNITIRTADGTYPPIACGQPPNGAGGIIILGNSSVPANCLIHAASGECIITGSNGYYFEGFMMQSDAPGAPPHAGAGIRIYNCIMQIRNMNFGACATAHMFVDAGATLLVSGVESGDPSGYYLVTGNTPYHIYCVENALLRLGQCAMSAGAVNCGVWAYCSANAVIASSYSSFTNAGVTGQKFLVNLNGVINTGGGVNYFPGNVAGVVNSGGQVF